MKKLSIVLFTTLLLTGCNSINESSWVETSNKEKDILSIVKPDDSRADTENKEGSNIKKPEIEQVKTEFWPQAPKFKFGKFTVSKIIEGNLIEVNGKEKVRLLGISTKTPNQYKRVYLKVPEELAIQYLSDEILNKTVYLEQHPKFPRNPDGETVAYVWMGDAEKLSNVNARMLEKGVALSDRIENVTVYDETFKKLENKANQSKMGFWKNIK